MSFQITGPGFYRQRDGSKAEIVGRQTKNNDRPWVGVYSEGSIAWSDSGRVLRSGETGIDIIAPWTDPKAGQIYVIIIEPPNGPIIGEVCSTRENAEDEAHVWTQRGRNVLAIKSVTWTEGEGL